MKNVRNSENKIPRNAERGGEFGFEAGRRVDSSYRGGNSATWKRSGDEEKGGEEENEETKAGNDGVGE